MNLQRAELFKVCRSLGWRGDIRLLWHALDADSAGLFGVMEKPLGGWRYNFYFGSTPNPVTVANEGLGWDSLLKMVIILVVTGILGGG